MTKRKNRNKKTQQKKSPSKADKNAAVVPAVETVVVEVAPISVAATATETIPVMSEPETPVQTTRKTMETDVVGSMLEEKKTVTSFAADTVATPVDGASDASKTDKKGESAAVSVVVEEIAIASTVAVEEETVAALKSEDKKKNSEDTSAKVKTATAVDIVRFMTCSPFSTSFTCLGNFCCLRSYAPL